MNLQGEILQENTVLRTIKVALTLLFIMRKYMRILQYFTETEWLPSVGFLTL